MDFLVRNLKVQPVRRFCGLDSGIGKLSRYGSIRECEGKEWSPNGLQGSSYVTKKGGIELE